ncbi:MFS monocarboxylate transporter [Talaromyces proteolyticus]|uniref:MFS monocarboxylate transporter n=1 Tax=Talaromyces proteolyticus TaxID=1131652 RepID=A0AAD4PV82_9EURO|nr:MFS monocarboxylate transporter [Talaromyces proteolyticus]KAH8690013.1 MFS monocarboxylate transporter [Talaromyces proteolyticus]
MEGELREMQNLRPEGQDSAIEASEMRQLPPVDGGKDAWLFLAACFIIEALVWGFTFSFGIFQDYYNTHEPFKGSGDIAIIGTCAMGVSYILAPLAFALLIAVPRFRRWATPVGFLIMCLSLALSSFSTSITQLILSQGIAYGIGANIGYAPTIIFMGEWFVKRKGLAFGIMWAGTGLSGVILPLVLQRLLDLYGFKTTLRVYALVLALLSAPLIYFVKPRLPVAQSSRFRPFDLRFLRNPTFLIYQVCNVVQALGFFLPTIYLPSYARSLGAGSLTSSLTVILVNLASVFGCVIMGHLTDRHNATTCSLISLIGSALSVFIIWGFSVTLAPLYVFCIAYGIFAGSFSSAWPAVTNDVMRQDPLAEASMILGFLETGRGIGNVVSGPLSEALLKNYAWKDVLKGGYGTGYGTLIVFTGATALLSALSIMAPPLRRMFGTYF